MALGDIDEKSSARFFCPLGIKPILIEYQAKKTPSVSTR